jgi:DNA-binding IclR family transcriptional regulator
MVPEASRLADRRATRNGEAAATIQSVERAAKILSFFTVSRPRLTLTEITARLGVSKATAHRYAMALRRVNLLRYDRAAADYTLGPQVLTLGAVARAGLPIITIAGPYMEQIVNEVNETAVLSVWDGEAPVVVRVDDSTERVVRISVRAGSRLSTLESAQGKVFCAFVGPEQIPELAAELDHNPALAAELAAIRDAGLAVNTPEIHGVRTIAAPVFSDGKTVAVMGVVGTTATISDDISSHAAKTLKRVAAELSEQFGTHGGAAADAVGDVVVSAP